MKFTVELEYTRMSNRSSSDALSVLLAKYGLSKTDVPTGRNVRSPSRTGLQQWAERWNDVSFTRLRTISGKQVVDLAANVEIVKVYRDGSVDSEVVICSDNAKPLSRLSVYFIKSMSFTKKAGMHISAFIDPQLFIMFLKKERLALPSSSAYIDIKFALNGANIRGLTTQKILSFSLYDVYKYYNKLDYSQQRTVATTFHDDVLPRFARTFMDRHDWGFIACLACAIEKQMLIKTGRRPRQQDDGSRRHSYYKALDPQTLMQRAFTGSKYNVIHGKSLKHKFLGAKLYYPFIEFRLHAPLPVPVYPYLIYIPGVWAELKKISLSDSIASSNAKILIKDLSDYYTTNVIQERNGDWWDNRRFKPIEVLTKLEQDTRALPAAKKHVKYLKQWKDYDWAYWERARARYQREVGGRDSGFFW